MDGREELENQVSTLTRLVAEMRARLSSLEKASVAKPAGDAPRSRRELLKLGGVAALGAVGAVALRAAPASAASGGNAVLGQANFADQPTTLKATQTGGVAPYQTLEAQATDFSAAALAAANTPSGLNPFFGSLQGLAGAGVVTGSSPTPVEGVDGWASGASSFGVYGFTDSGTGVVGESATGVSLYARRSGRIRQDPRIAGVPNYNPSAPEQVRDANGVLWINNPTGVWRRVNSMIPIAPIRVIDSRGGIGYPNPQPLGQGTGPWAPNSVHTFTIAGVGPGFGIPIDAVGLIGNITSLSPTSGGFMTIFPGGLGVPQATSVNFLVGTAAMSNLCMVALGTGGNVGSVSIYASGGGSVGCILDIVGYVI